jgi:hypothetical protein
MKEEFVKLINIATETSPYSVQLTSDVQTYVFYGNKTLAANFTIQAVGTPTEGMAMWMLFTGSLVTGSNVFNILGTAMNVTGGTTNVTANPFLAICIYGNAGWHVTRLPLSPLIASGIFTTDAYGNLTIGGGEVTNAMLAGSIAYAKLSLAGALLNTDLHATFAMPLTQLAASTVNVIPKFGSTGLLEPTAVTPAQLAFVDFTSSGQDQLDAITTDLGSNYSDNTALASLISAYYTSTQTDVAIVNALAGLTTIWNGTTLAATTDLNTFTSWYQEYLLDPTSGAISLGLPAKSKFATGEWIKFTLVNSATPSTINGNGAEVMTNFSGAAIPTITLSAIGDYVKLAKVAGGWFVVETNV